MWGGGKDEDEEFGHGDFLVGVGLGASVKSTAFNFDRAGIPPPVLWLTGSMYPGKASVIGGERYSELDLGS